MCSVIFLRVIDKVFTEVNVISFLLLPPPSLLLPPTFFIFFFLHRWRTRSNRKKLISLYLFFLLFFISYFVFLSLLPFLWIKKLCRQKEILISLHFYFLLIPPALSSSSSSSPFPNKKYAHNQKFLYKSIDGDFVEAV